MFSFLKDVMNNTTKVTDVAADERSELARVMCELLVEAARIDDGMGDEEAHVIAHIMSEHFDIAEDDINTMFVDAITASKERIQMHGLAKNLRDMTDYEERYAMLELIWMVVLADDHLDHMEASLMRRLAGLLYIEDVDSGKAAKSAKARLAL